MKKKKIIGFGQLRNERENGNLENWFKCMEPCDYIYIFDQASTDNSKEIYEKYDNVRVIYSPENRFTEELLCKDELYRLMLKEHPDVDWVLWLDGDLLLDGRLLKDNNLQKLCNKLDEANVDLPCFGHYNLWRSDKWYRKDNAYHDLHMHWFPLWGHPQNKWFDRQPGLHHGQVPQGTQKAALVDVSVIHFGFKNEEKVVNKYLHYKSLGQSGWALDRLIDEETLDVDEVPNEIYPEWFKIEDDKKPTEKELLINLYKDKLNA